MKRVVKHAFPILIEDLEKDDWGESTYYVVQLLVRDHYDNYNSLANKMVVDVYNQSCFILEQEMFSKLPVYRIRVSNLRQIAQ